MKIGLIGAGHISTSHLQAWRRARECRLWGIHDLDRNQAGRQAARFGIPHLFDGLEPLLAEVDLVDVCTPPGSHAAILLQALDAGRHVLVEKPVVTRLEDWEPIKARLERGPSKLAVIHNLKFSRGILKARGWIERQRIGKILRLTRTFLTDPQHDRMLAAEGHWSHGLPGGRWFETLPHELYLTHSLLGPLKFAGVQCCRTRTAPPGAPADEVAITLQGPDSLAAIHFSANCQLNKRELVIEGSRGSIRVDILGDRARLFRHRDRRWGRPLAVPLLDNLAQAGGWAPDRIAYLGDRLLGLTPHARIIRAFAAHLLDGGPNPTPLAEVDYVIRNAEAIGRAIDAAVTVETDVNG
jgi:predicted dehydrogenase